MQSFEGAFGDNESHFQSKTWRFLHDLFKKETFGKNIYNDYVNGMSIFPMKVKTGEEKCPKWVRQGLCGEVHTLEVFLWVEAASLAILIDG